MTFSRYILNVLINNLLFNFRKGRFFIAEYVQIIYVTIMLVISSTLDHHWFLNFYFIFVFWALLQLWTPQYFGLV